MKQGEGMLIGYCRVSTDSQETSLQEDALKKAGCEKIITDIASGAQDERKGLQEIISFARSGDVVIVWKLDRLGRSLKKLIEMINFFNNNNIGFQSLTESIDTTTPGGKLVFHIFGGLAEFERELIRSRTKAGLEAARARGRVGGRPQALDEKKQELAKTLLKDTNLPVKSICQMLGVSRSTLYRNYE